MYVFTYSTTPPTKPPGDLSFPPLSNLIMSLWPQNWWLIAAIAVAFVSVIFATIFPVVIMPLFNKYSPIETGELTERLSSLLKRTGLKASGFFMEDMSKQTKKENAFLGGLGRTRRVVLGDNLINNMLRDN